MNQGRCIDCRWWGDSDDAKDREAAISGTVVMLRCQAIRHPEECSYFEVPAGLPDNFEMAYVNDASGYTASLNTAPTFSCSLFKAREL